MLGKLDFFTFIGVFLIILGAVFLLILLLVKLGADFKSVHPLILLGKRFDGVYIGTSPILIIILLLVYLALAFLRR